MNRFDIIIWGASSFTGKLVTEYFFKKFGSNKIKWAIAGRNKDKLEELANLCKNNKPEIVIGDSDNKAELCHIASITKVVLSFAGPFNKYSNNLVSECVENGTHYVDITGENLWVRELIDKHHSEAAYKGIRIVPSCGYDSIPSDLGAFFTVSQFNKPVTRVDVYHEAQGGASGGTTETIFTMDGLTKEMRDPFVLNPEESVSEEQRQKSRDGFAIKQVDGIDGWSGIGICLLYTSPSPRDRQKSRMPSSA